MLSVENLRVIPAQTGTQCRSFQMAFRLHGSDARLCSYFTGHP
jgi:hypothetical protein